MMYDYTIIHGTVSYDGTIKHCDVYDMMGTILPLYGNRYCTVHQYSVSYCVCLHMQAHSHTHAYGGAAQLEVGYLTESR